MSPEQVQAIMERAAKPDFDPTLNAVIQFVHAVKNVAIAEATGFWTARTANEQLELVTAEFIDNMEKATVPGEG